MFKKILLAFVIAAGVVLGLVVMQPDTYSVTRSATIAAPPAAVYAAVNDFHKWQEWSPWARLDPAMQQTYSGPPSGVGSRYAWSGNDKAGAGAMAITESVPNDHVTFNLNFTRPYASSSVFTFSLRPERTGSRVTWAMTGRNNFALKAVSLFSSMDKFLGPDFEKGLAQLKHNAEAEAVALPAR